MQGPLYLGLQQLREFMAVRDGPRFLRQVLEDDARVVRASEKSSVNPHGSLLHEGGRTPHQHDSEHSAQGHPHIRVCLNKAGKNMSKDADRYSCRRKKQH